MKRDDSYPDKRKLTLNQGITSMVAWTQMLCDSSQTFLFADTQKFYPVNVTKFHIEYMQR